MNSMIQHNNDDTTPGFSSQLNNQGPLLKSKLNVGHQRNYSFEQKAHIYKNKMPQYNTHLV